MAASVPAHQLPKSNFKVNKIKLLEPSRVEHKLSSVVNPYKVQMRRNNSQSNSKAFRLSISESKMNPAGNTSTGYTLTSLLFGKDPGLHNSRDLCRDTKLPLARNNSKIVLHSMRQSQAETNNPPPQFHMAAKEGAQFTRNILAELKKQHEIKKIEMDRGDRHKPSRMKYFDSTRSKFFDISKPRLLESYAPTHSNLNAVGPTKHNRGNLTQTTLYDALKKKCLDRLQGRDTSEDSLPTTRTAQNLVKPQRQSASFVVASSQAQNTQPSQAVPPQSMANLYKMSEEKLSQKNAGSTFTSGKDLATRIRTEYLEPEPRVPPEPTPRTLIIKSLEKAKLLEKEIESYDIRKVTSSIPEDQKLDSEDLVHFSIVHPGLMNILSQWGFFQGEPPLNSKRPMKVLKPLLFRGFRRYMAKLKRLGLDAAEVMSKPVFSKKPFDKPGFRAFLDAVKEGNFRFVLLALEANKYLVYGYDHAVMTALLWAVKRKYTNLVLLLIKFGADVDHIDTLGRTALSIALSNQDVFITKILLYFKADPDLAIRNNQLIEITGGNNELITAIQKAHSLRNEFSLGGSTASRGRWNKTVSAAFSDLQFQIELDPTNPFSQDKNLWIVR